MPTSQPLKTLKSRQSVDFKDQDELLISFNVDEGQSLRPQTTPI
jgi:hypothetical protein